MATCQCASGIGQRPFGRPEKRNRHSMVLQPETGALYVFGGLLELTGLGSDSWTFCTGER